MRCTGGESRGAVHVGDALAARVVEQDGEHVALRHRARRPRAPAAAGRRARAAAPRRAALPSTMRSSGRTRRGARRARPPVPARPLRRAPSASRRHHRRQHEVTAFEDARRVLEEEREEGFEEGGHGVSIRTAGPARWRAGRGATAGWARRNLPRVPAGRRACRMNAQARTRGTAPDRDSPGIPQRCAATMSAQASVLVRRSVMFRSSAPATHLCFSTPHPLHVPPRPSHRACLASGVAGPSARRRGPGRRPGPAAGSGQRDSLAQPIEGAVISAPPRVVRGRWCSGGGRDARLLRLAPVSSLDERASGPSRSILVRQNSRGEMEIRARAARRAGRSASSGRPSALLRMGRAGRRVARAHERRDLGGLHARPWARCWPAPTRSGGVVELRLDEPVAGAGWDSRAAVGHRPDGRPADRARHRHHPVRSPPARDLTVRGGGSYRQRDGFTRAAGIADVRPGQSLRVGTDLEQCDGFAHLSLRASPTVRRWGPPSPSYDASRGVAPELHVGVASLLALPRSPPLGAHRRRGRRRAWLTGPASRSSRRASGAWRAALAASSSSAMPPTAR